MTNDLGNGLTTRAFIPDKDRAVTDLRDGMRAWCDLLHRVDDLAAPAVGTWTVRDLAAHFVGGLELYAGLLHGESSPIRTWSDIEPANDALVRGISQPGPSAFAEAILAGTDRFLGAAEALPGNPDVPWHFGLSMPLSSIVGLIVGEVAVHGYDLARSQRVRWRIPDSWGHTAFRAATPALPLFLDPEASAGVRVTYDIRMRGADGPRVVVRIADGELTLHHPGTPGRVDCYLSGDPLTLLLVLYGRMGTYAAAARGKALARGRRPWAGLAMTKLLRTP